MISLFSLSLFRALLMRQILREDVLSKAYSPINSSYIIWFYFSAAFLQNSYHYFFKFLLFINSLHDEKDFTSKTARSWSISFITLFWMRNICFLKDEKKKNNLNPFLFYQIRLSTGFGNEQYLCCLFTPYPCTWNLIGIR